MLEPVKDINSNQNVKYQCGFGNYHSSEALPDTLPIGHNNPQVCPRGLYSEQISGTAFTKDRVSNLFTWMYRLQPSVCHSTFRKKSIQNPFLGHKTELTIDPNQLRWKPFIGQSEGNFIDSLKTICCNGAPEDKNGLAIHIYNFTTNMSSSKTVAVNADGDFLIVPQLQTLKIQTELGILIVEPNEIAVIPRGFRFTVDIAEQSSEDGNYARGYILEVYKGHFELPSLGAIGANGLAGKRDFMYPTARFEDKSESWKLCHKFMSELYEAELDHCPFDVVAWHGNYSPYKYDLRKFCVVNTVSFDHLDPSIFTVLTCPSDDAGTATADFVIFPPRWIVATNTFRPPYYHRNCMTEFMGMIWGKYDAKEGFMPGGGSLHSCMTPHGPDAETFRKASDNTSPQPPVYFDQGLAFMFECNAMLKVANWALEPQHLDEDYQKCWQGLKKAELNL